MPVTEERRKKIMGITPQLEENLGNIRVKIAVLSGKGGVGKSTVAANLAFGLSNRGLDTGIIDADIHGPDIARMLSIENKQLLTDGKRIKPVRVNERLWAVSLALSFRKDEPVIWRGPLKTSAIRQFIGDVKWPPLDALVIDLPPGTGDEAITVAQLIPDAHAVIVTTPQEVAMLDSRRAVKFAEESGMKILGIIENMSGFICPHCGNEVNIFKKGNAQAAAKEFEVRFLGSIPIDALVVESTDKGHPVASEKGPASSAFSSIVDSISEMLFSQD